jgi:hypothetical protein
MRTGRPTTPKEEGNPTCLREISARLRPGADAVPPQRSSEPGGQTESHPQTMDQVQLCGARPRNRSIPLDCRTIASTPINIQKRRSTPRVARALASIAAATASVSKRSPTSAIAVSTGPGRKVSDARAKASVTAPAAANQRYLRNRLRNRLIPLYLKDRTGAWQVPFGVLEVTLVTYSATRRPFWKSPAQRCRQPPSPAKIKG